MADELFKGFMVGSAIAQNIKLQQIQGLMAQEEMERQRLKQNKDYIHNIRTEVEKCIHAISSSPSYAYLRSFEILEDIHANNISPASFTELVDKEYCTKVIQNAEKVIHTVEENLSTEQINSLKQYYATTKQLHAMKEYKNWKQIHAKVPHEPLDFLTKMWRAGGIKRLMLFPILLFPLVNSLLTLAFVNRMVNRFILLNSRFPEIERLASETGGWVTKDILKSQAKEIMKQAEQNCYRLGLTASDLTEVDTNYARVEKFYKELEASCSQYQIAA